MNTDSYILWDKVTKIGLAQPGVYERLCYGTPALYVEKKFFARLKEDNETLVLYNNDRDEWMASNPDVFFITDHYKNYPMLLIDLKAVSKNELEQLITLSWKLRAPKKLLSDKKPDIKL